MKFPGAIENLFQRFRPNKPTDDDQLARLNSELERLRQEKNSVTAESLRNAYENLFKDLSSPISQLLLQIHLASGTEHALTAADVLVHVKILIATLERHGVTVVGQPGEIQRFDPNLHQPLTNEFQPASSDLVCIRFPGISYQGTLLRKAAVDSLEKN